MLSTGQISCILEGGSDDVGLKDWHQIQVPVGYFSIENLCAIIGNQAFQSQLAVIAFSELTCIKIPLTILTKETFLMTIWTHFM